MSEFTLHIDDEGTPWAVASPELAGVLATLGQARVRRASHVVPVDRILRAAFRGLRALVRDESRLAGWSRRWPCLWRAEIVGGPVLGPFGDRAEAIRAEVAWIDANETPPGGSIAPDTVSTGDAR